MDKPPYRDHIEINIPFIIPWPKLYSNNLKHHPLLAPTRTTMLHQERSLKSQITLVGRRVLQIKPQTIKI